MFSYPETELTDQEIADMVAYLDTLTAGAKPPTAEWRTPLPKMAPRGQQLGVGIWGCGQCHGATFDTPRHGAAEVTGDFEWFKRQVYDHSKTQREQMAMLDPNAAAGDAQLRRTCRPARRLAFAWGTTSRAAAA